MRSLTRRRAADATSVLLAGVLLNVAVYESLRDSTAKLALFAVLAVAVEALRRVPDDRLPDALEGDRFTLTSPVQLATLFVAGAWIAAAVAGMSLVAVGVARSEPTIGVLRRASAL